MYPLLGVGKHQFWFLIPEKCIHNIPKVEKPSCRSTDERINDVCMFVHAIEYYLVKNEVLICTTTEIELENII